MGEKKHLQNNHFLDVEESGGNLKEIDPSKKGKIITSIIFALILLAVFFCWLDGQNQIMEMNRKLSHVDWSVARIDNIENKIEINDRTMVCTYAGLKFDFPEDWTPYGLSMRIRDKSFITFHFAPFSKYNWINRRIGDKLQLEDFIDDYAPRKFGIYPAEFFYRGASIEVINEKKYKKFEYAVKKTSQSITKIPKYFVLVSVENDMFYYFYLYIDTNETDEYDSIYLDFLGTLESVKYFEPEAEKISP